MTKQKINIKEVLVMMLIYLFVISIMYIVYQKACLLIH